MKIKENVNNNVRKIIAFDPGVRNFAYSILSIEQPATTILSGHLKNPIFSIKEADVKNSVSLFLWEVEDLFKRIGYNNEQDRIIIERYQSRGVYKNNQIELVNMMIGILLGHYDALPVMPSTWKTFIKRRYGSSDMLHLLQNSNLSPHMADATGMATFYAERYCEKEKLIDQLKSTMQSWTLEGFS